MLVLAAAACVVLIFVALIVGVRVMRARRLADLSRLIPVSQKDLIQRALIGVKSLTSEMEMLEEILHPAAYAGFTARAGLSPDVCAERLAWLEAAKVYLRRINSNLATFEDLGQRALLFSLGEDSLALEIVTKAAGCKLELRQIRRRIAIYNLVPVAMWPLLGRKLPGDCVYAGNGLIEQYRSLAERVLVFVRFRTDYHRYETLRSAM